MLRLFSSWATLAVILTCGFSAHADEDRPHPGGLQGTHPFFVEDADDARVLHGTAELFERGPDRELLQALTKPRLSDETLDALEAAGAPRGAGTAALADGGVGSMLTATALDGNVFVVEGIDPVVVQTNQGPMFNHNGGAFNEVINAVWSLAGDEFDFITVFTTFDDPGAAGYYFPLQRQVTNIGECNPQQQIYDGCVFSQFPPQFGEVELDGFVFMNSVDYWRGWDINYSGGAKELSDWDASVYAVMGQEVTHQWLATMRFIDPRNSALSYKLLGRDGSHWAAWVQSDASVQDGWEWEELEDGTFRAVSLMDGFSTLDLYALGVLPSNAAEPFYFIDNAVLKPIPGFISQQPLPADAALQLPDPGFISSFGYNIEVTGNRVDLVIDDVVQAEGGVRCPSPDDAQKAYRQAVVLVTSPTQGAGFVGAYVNELEEVMQNWEGWFTDRTRGGLKICTGPGEPCEHATVTITGGSTDRDGDIVDPGDDFSLSVRVAAEGEAVTGSVVQVALEGAGAEHATLLNDTFDLESLLVESPEELSIGVELSGDYPCGDELVFVVTFTGDNAETVQERFFVRPGLEKVWETTFSGSSEEFEFEGDSLTGAFLQASVTTTCDMSSITPAKDASPEGNGAVVTSTDLWLTGTTTVRTPEIELGEAQSPEVQFAFWLAGEGGTITVMLQGDGGDWVEALTIDDSLARTRWQTASVSVESGLGEVPEALRVAFVGDGNGVELGIDDVVVYQAAGACFVEEVEPEPTGDGGPLPGCDCDSSRDGSPLAAGLGGLLVLGLVRRRRGVRAS